MAHNQTVIFLTATGANTWTVPTDWSNTNTIECISGGASGGIAANTGSAASGGGGGAYSAISNLSTLTPGQSVNYTVGLGGSAPAYADEGAQNGNAGGDTWFNGTTLSGSSVGAKGGNGGNAIQLGGTCSGATGGQASLGVGTTKHNGGGSGTISSGAAAQSATGGGGAAGPNGDGNTSSGFTSGNHQGGNGASADAGHGGAGGFGYGASGVNTGSDTAQNGGVATEWTDNNGDTAGPGGGGGAMGYLGTGATAVAGAGGQYGGGGGGVAVYWEFGAGQSAPGYQGIIVITYTPGQPIVPGNSGKGKQNTPGRTKKQNAAAYLSFIQSLGRDDFRGVGRNPPIAGLLPADPRLLYTPPDRRDQMMLKIHITRIITTGTAHSVQREP